MDVFRKLRDLKTILIDDDIWIRGAFSMLFESESCNLTAVETAEEGLKALHNDDYDLIIIDYKLPGLNGIEFLKRMPESYSDTIIIMMTAYLNSGLKADAKKLNVKEMIEKPFSTQEFLASLVSVLPNPGRHHSNS